MDETATTGTQPEAYGGQAQLPQPGQESTSQVLGHAMGRPVSVGLVLFLVVANTIGWLWFVNHQDEQFQQLQSQVGNVQVSVPSGATDPALCWLIGAQARAAGREKALVDQVAISGIGDECIDAVTRGANGYGR